MGLVTGFTCGAHVDPAELSGRLGTWSEESLGSDAGQVGERVPGSLKDLSRKAVVEQHEKAAINPAIV